jgi:hypothetical protein
MVGASSLDGFDPASWTYVLVAATDAGPAFALLGKVTDPKVLATSAGSALTMIKGGWAVIGPKPILEQVGAYALAAIAGQPAPTAPSATVYLPHVLARYHTQLEAVRGQLLASLPTSGGGAMGQMMTAYVDGLMSLAGDTDQLTATLEATPDSATLDLALTPRPKSRLAKFVALQRPTDYALFDRLPAVSPTMLFGGHVDTGPYREGMLAVMAAIYGPAANKDLLAAMDAFRKTMTGDLAMAMQIAPGTGMAFTQLFGLSDAKAADKAMTAMLELFKAPRTMDLPNATTTIHANPDATIYDGVKLRSYETTYDLSKAQPAQRKAMEAMLPGGTHHTQIAAFDGLGIVIASPDSLADAKRAIDAARGKPPRFVAGSALGDLFAASRAHKDSVAMVFDLGGLLGAITGATGGSGQPMMVSLGCADQRAHLRIALPAATARAAANLGKP